MALQNWDLSDDEKGALSEAPKQKKSKIQKQQPHMLAASAVPSESAAGVKKRKARDQGGDAGPNNAILSSQEPREVSTRRKLKATTAEKTTIKAKFTMSSSGAMKSRGLGNILKVQPTEPDFLHEAVKEIQEWEVPEEESGVTDDTNTKPKRATVSAMKRKSLKHKQRKKKKKMDELRSKMPREKLEELFNPKQPELSSSQAALNYLRLWNSTRPAWKFSKLRQTWLLTHMYSTKDVCDSDFDVLLRYLQHMKGSSLTETLKKAKEMVDKYEALKDRDSKTITARATKILQLLDAV